MPGNGREESKCSWSGRTGHGHQGGGGLSCSPPRDRDRVVHASAGGGSRSARRGRPVIRPESTEVSAEAGAGADGNPLPLTAGGRGCGLLGRSESASPSPPWRVASAEERKGRGGGGGSSKWGHDEEGGDRLDSVSPPPWPGGGEIVMALSGGGNETGGGRRRRRGLAWGQVPAGAAAAAAAAGVGGGGGDGGCSSSRRTELPPCPVCFDRLDPAVSGVPSARTGESGFNTRGGRLGRGVGGLLTVRSGGSSKHERSEGRGPRWEGERAGEGGGSPVETSRRQQEGEEGKGQGGDPALNMTIWKGSNCRVCRSLNVALEGAPDEVCMCLCVLRQYASATCICRG